jgi:hypothetical protein
MLRHNRKEIDPAFNSETPIFRHNVILYPFWIKYAWFMEHLMHTNPLLKLIIIVRCRIKNFSDFPFSFPTPLSIYFI